MFALFESDQLERQLQAGWPLNPIKEVRIWRNLISTFLIMVQEKTFCNVPGVILHMEFLHPASNDSDYVILVLFIVESVAFFTLPFILILIIGSAKQKFRLILYEWWTSKPLSTAARYAQNGLRLPDG